MDQVDSPRIERCESDGVSGLTVAHGPPCVSVLRNRQVIPGVPVTPYLAQKRGPPGYFMREIDPKLAHQADPLSNQAKPDSSERAYK